MSDNKPLNQQPAFPIEVSIFLALDALKFIPGDWSPESVTRHLQEQIQLAVKHLESLVDDSPQQYLVFSDWQAGHHGICPPPMPVAGEAHARAILWTMTRCVIQGQGFRAKLATPDEDLTFWYVGEDFVTVDDGDHWEEAGIAPGWKQEVRYERRG